MSNHNTKLGEALISLQNRLTKVSKRLEAVENRPDADTTAVTDLATDTNLKLTLAHAAIATQDKNLRSNSTSTTSALNALRDSTTRAFEGVTKDVKSAYDCATRHNARISALEGADGVRTTTLSGVRNQLITVLDRIAKLEEKPVDTSALSLEAELKALLTRFGYKVIGVGVTKSTYDGVASLAFPARQTEGVEIKLSGTKAL